VPQKIKIKTLGYNLRIYVKIYRNILYLHQIIIFRNSNCLLQEETSNTDISEIMIITLGNDPRLHAEMLHRILFYICHK